MKRILTLITVTVIIICSLSYINSNQQTINNNKKIETLNKRIDSLRIDVVDLYFKNYKDSEATEQLNQLIQNLK